jgi:putative tryptophan/tyrosine transport system substrate-binding protein
MKRRHFIALLGGAVTWPVTVRTQQTTPVVAFVFSGTASSTAAPYVTAFKLGLEEAGLVEGRNVAIEYHLPGGHDEGLPALMAELAQRRVAVIVGDTSPSIAARKATSTIPIVFVTGTDPVSVGLVDSFNRPGSNATGVTFLTATLDAKRLDLLHELLPKAKVIASLLDPNYPASASQRKNLSDAARALGHQIHFFQASDESELDQAFATMANLHPDALVVSASAFMGSHLQKIVELAARNSLPAMYFNPEFPVFGGLISYGANVPDAFRQAGGYTGRILKGEKPAEMPVLLFDLVINLKTAKALGIDVPPSLLALADEVIE